MNNVGFIIEGDGSEQFVIDWALGLGYQTEIEGQPNTQTHAEYIAETTFQSGCTTVCNYREQEMLNEAKEQIKIDVAASMEGITLGE